MKNGMPKVPKGKAKANSHQAKVKASPSKPKRLRGKQPAGESGGTMAKKAKEEEAQEEEEEEEEEPKPAKKKGKSKKQPEPENPEEPENGEEPNGHDVSEAKPSKKRKRQTSNGTAVPEEVLLYVKKIDKFLVGFQGLKNRKCDEKQKELLKTKVIDLTGDDLTCNIYWSKTGAGLKSKSEGKDFAYRALTDESMGTWVLRMAIVLKAAELMVACVH